MTLHSPYDYETTGGGQDLYKMVRHLMEMSCGCNSSALLRPVTAADSVEQAGTFAREDIATLTNECPDNRDLHITRVCLNIYLTHGT